MPDLLGRPLTTPERLVKAALEKAVARAATTDDLAAALRALSQRSPDCFCTAALSLLGSTTEVPALRRLYNTIAETPSFWIELLRAERFSRSELVEVCRYLTTIEDVLDVRLARLLPGRNSNASLLSQDTVLRALDLLDQLSSGSRLILLVNHLTTHPDRRIASKATLLVGRRIRNQDWLSKHLDSEDGRVRASAVEGLWGVASPQAQAAFCAALKDKNNRVVGNALIGLHRLGEPCVNEFLKRMIEDPRPPFRWTAAWVMGKVGAEEFLESLDRAAKDKEVHVRRQAERAIETILHGSFAETAATNPHP